MVRKQENRIVNDWAVIMHKNVGETPLEALERFRAEQIAAGARLLDGSGYEKVPMTYAGRLDPMAEGELLILIGEECKKKERYLGLDKEYEIEVVFGIETDTYDALGLVVEVHSTNSAGEISGRPQGEDILPGISEQMTKKVATFNQTYPAYSSRTVDGVQLHELARAGELPDEMPGKEVTIYSIDILGTRKITADELKRNIMEKISLVKGDFRQAEIIQKWNEVLTGGDAGNFDHSDRFESSDHFDLIRLRVKCSSGTYMRSLAHELGKDIGTGAFALSIKRTAIFPRQ